MRPTARPAMIAIIGILLASPFLVQAQTDPTVSITDNGQSTIVAPKAANYIVAWSSSNVTSCTLSWQGTGPNASTAGSTGVAPNQSASGPSGLIGSYTLTCVGPNGPISATATATQSTTTPAPTCSMAFNPSSGPPNTASTLTWTSTGATTANIAPWGGEPVNGSIPNARSGQTVVSTGTFTGAGGTTTCTSTLFVVRPPGLDKLTLSTATGTAPLAVTFTALANAGGSCNALTYTIAYGDGQTQEIDVPVNLCQQKSLSYAHTYTTVGTFTAGYYLGTPQQVAAGTATLITSSSVQTQSPPNPLAVDVFLIAGQSNGLGYIPGAASITSPIVPAGKVLQYYNGVISNADDPVGASVNGSAWPSFGVTYYGTNGHLLLFVPDAIGGSCQTPQGVQGTGGPPTEDYWSDTTSSGGFWVTSVNYVKQAEAALTQAGYTPTFKGVLWDQGECDAEGGIDENILTQAQYQSALAQMIAAYRVQFGSTMPFYIFRTGTHINANDMGYAQVRQAQDNISATDPNSWVVFRDAVNFPAKGWMQADGLHYTQDGYSEMGTQGATNVIGAQNGTYSHVATSTATSTLTATATITANGQSTIVDPTGMDYTVAWSSSNVTSCTLSWQGTGPNAGVSGSQGIAPDQSASGPSGLIGSYAISCTGPNGSASATTTITVSAAPPPPAGKVLITVNGTSTIVYTGGYTVAWSSSSVNSCTFSWLGSGPNAGVSGSEAMPPNQSFSGGSGLIGSYTFTCIDINGVTISKTVTITTNSPTALSSEPEAQSQTASVGVVLGQLIRSLGQLIFKL